VGIWLIDQWRQIGLNVKQTVSNRQPGCRRKNPGISKSRPTPVQLHRRTRHGPALVPHHVPGELQPAQGHGAGRAVPEADASHRPGERRKYLRAFEKRLYDEEVHYIMTFQWHRIIPHLAKVRGWTITPSHYLNNQLDTVWLSE